MEKPLFPSEYMRLTQKYNEGTHISSFAIDNAGKDSGISDIYAPYTGIIKKIYQNDANEVWLESINQVQYPDGTVDYMTILFAHANNVDNLFVGKTINKGEVFYSEGTKGNASGNHCHIECGRGKFTGSGWHKNTSGYWSINNGEKPELCLWVDDSIKIIDSKSLDFKKIPVESDIANDDKNQETDNNQGIDNGGQTNNSPGTNNSTNEDAKNNSEDKKEKPQDNELPSKELFTFIAPKTDLYGVYLKENQKLTIDKSS